MPKWGVMHSLFNFLFGNQNSSAEINTIKNTMAILEENQDIFSSLIQKTKKYKDIQFCKSNLHGNYITNWLLLKSLQEDIFQINNTVHHLSKELKALFHDRNFFIIMFHLRSHLPNLRSGINSVRIDILSILNLVLLISLQSLNLHY